MLPALNRLTRREDFATAVRRGRRAARRTLVVHLARSPSPQVPPSSGVPSSTGVSPPTPVSPPTRVSESDLPGLDVSNAKVSPQVGFIVGRPVGGAVVRHRVQRQLRHVMRSRLDLLPDGALVVVRALPAAADAGSAALGDDLDAALRRLT